MHRVLVIEDNVDSANTLRDLLRMSDHEEVEVAYDGPSSIELARKFQPDIVVCDIGLPGADGYEVAQRFKAGGQDTAQYCPGRLKWLTQCPKISTALPLPASISI